MGIIQAVIPLSGSMKKGRRTGDNDDPDCFESLPVPSSTIDIVPPLRMTTTASHSSGK